MPQETHSLFGVGLADFENKGLAIRVGVLAPGNALTVWRRRRRRSILPRRRLLALQADAQLAIGKPEVALASVAAG
jgi:hypothetical protein